MTVARDSILESATFTTTSPHTFTGPTPVGTPRAVLVFIAMAGASDDRITGAVTYGGVAMARPTNGFAQDTAGEVGAVYAYFLGASIPAGAQTISITHTAQANVKWAICALATAGADTEIVVSGKLEGDAADPSIALDTSATSALRYSILQSGKDAITSLTVLSGMEANDAATSHDYGTVVAVTGQETTASTGSFTIGYTGVTDDIAMLAVAIQEVSGAATVDPYPYIGGGYYPVEG